MSFCAISFTKDLQLFQSDESKPHLVISLLNFA